MNKAFHHIVITGASRGLGNALTREFSGHSWIVIPLVRTHDDACRLKSINPDRCFPIVSDVTGKTLSHDVKIVLDHLGPIDVLVNNAGTGSHGALLNETDPAVVLASIGVHCLGALRVTQSVMPYMSPTGKIINISSRFGSMARVSSGDLDHIACSYAYRIAKAAQNMFTQCLCREFQSSGLTVCAVHPGQLKTCSASSDAQNTTGSAANALYRLLDHMEHGVFYNLFEDSIPW